MPNGSSAPIVEPAGLTADEARARRDQFGPNEPAPARVQLVFARVWRVIANPLVLILLIAAVASVFLGQTVDATIIFIIIVVISAAIDLAQTHRSVLIVMARVGVKIGSGIMRSIGSGSTLFERRGNAGFDCHNEQGEDLLCRWTARKIGANRARWFARSRAMCDQASKIPRFCGISRGGDGISAGLTGSRTGTLDSPVIERVDLRLGLLSSGTRLKAIDLHNHASFNRPDANL